MCVKLITCSVQAERNHRLAFYLVKYGGPHHTRLHPAAIALLTGVLSLSSIIQRTNSTESSLHIDAHAGAICSRLSRMVQSRVGALCQRNEKRPRRKCFSLDLLFIKQLDVTNALLIIYFSKHFLTHAACPGFGGLDELNGHNCL